MTKKQVAQLMKNTLSNGTIASHGTNAFQASMALNGSTAVVRFGTVGNVIKIGTMFIV